MSRDGRVIGVDVARGLAILGMFVLHALPPASIPALTFLTDDARPQILFAALDGVALGLMSGGAGNAAPPERRAYRRRIAVRAVLFVALGLSLATLESGVVVILDFYGIYFLLVLPALFARTRVIAAMAATLLLLGPSVATVAANAWGSDYVPLVSQVQTWLLFGEYPAVVWLGYIFSGLLVARSGVLHRTGALAWAAICGSAGLLATVVAHLPAPPVITQVATSLGSLGIAIALILGLTRLAIAPAHSRNVARMALTPLAAAGRMPVSLYVLHVVYLAIIAAVQGAGSPAVPDTRSLLSFFALTATAFTFAIWWSARLGRGPLERFAQWLTPGTANPSGGADTTTAGTTGMKGGS